MEDMLLKVPVIKTVYRTIKQIIDSISGPGRQAFKKVVFIEYPRKGIWTLTLVTGETIDDHGNYFYHIFVPTTPNPTSGFLLFINKKDVVESNMSIEDAMKTIISGGMIPPDLSQLG